MRYLVWVLLVDAVQGEAGKTANDRVGLCRRCNCKAKGND